MNGKGVSESRLLVSVLYIGGCLGLLVRGRSSGGVQVPVDHLLLGDEVAGLAQQGHEAVEVARPVVQHLVGLLVAAEADHPVQPVHLGPHPLGHHQLRKQLLRALLREVQKLRHALQSDAGVVLGHHPDVMLYDAALEVLPVALAQLVPLGEDGALGSAQLGLVGLAEAAPVDELRGEEELEQLLVLRQLVQPLVRLGAVQQVVLLVVMWGQH
uniref:Uncharacterized protein n=1 Tax=Ixodes ricinus TaxID=34613 RepID=A0A6B0V2D8_IXORI